MSEPFEHWWAQWDGKGSIEREAFAAGYEYGLARETVTAERTLEAWVTLSGINYAQSQTVMKLALVAIALFACGCAGPRRYPTPSPMANAPYVSVGEITGATGIGLMTNMAEVDLATTCTAALCIGEPGQELVVEGIEVYPVVVDGRNVLVVRGKLKERRGKP